MKLKIKIDNISYNTNNDLYKISFKENYKPIVLFDIDINNKNIKKIFIKNYIYHSIYFNIDNEIIKFISKNDLKKIKNNMNKIDHLINKTYNRNNIIMNEKYYIKIMDLKNNIKKDLNRIYNEIKDNINIKFYLNETELIFNNEFYLNNNDNDLYYLI